MGEISVVVLDMDRYASGLSGYPVTSTSDCIAKPWENCGLARSVVLSNPHVFKIICSPDI